MNKTIMLGKYTITVYEYNTVIIGSGAAGLAAANELRKNGKRSFCKIGRAHV